MGATSQARENHIVRSSVILLLPLYTILIFKSGDKTDLHNNRGISLQNCIAKLNERLIKHYENLVADQQFGFRSNHRTTDSIFIFKTLLSKYLYQKKRKRSTHVLLTGERLLTLYGIMDYYINLFQMVLGRNFIK